MTKIFNVFNNKTAVTCCIGLLLLHSSCTKNFEDFNTNENQATEEMLQTDNLSTGSLIVQMEKNVFPIAQQPMFGDEVYQVMQNLAGDSYAGYMGTTNNFLSGANNTTYALVPGWYGQAFSRAFVGVMPAWKRIAKSAKTQTPEVYAIANIIKVEALHRTTDMYGPLPYVNFGETTSQGRYDSQKDIYDKFFDELDEAIEILTDFNTRFPTTKTLTSYDFIYGGSIPNWIKFANSLKLRLAMRIAYADPNKAKVEAEAAVSHKIGVMSSATDIAALQHSSSLVYNHPLFIIANPDNFNDTRMGAVMDSYLNGLKDPRLPKYFNAASDGTYRGIRSGININNKATYASGTFSTLNIEASANITWFNPAEAYFLRAEGAIRGWNMGGTAQSLYEQGIKTSFELNSISASADTYISNETNTPANYSDPRNGANSASASSSITVKWNDAASFETKLERIITQKWIAVYPDGQEAWSEFRRTGYPKIFPVVVNNSQGQISTDVQIRRLPFPVNEYQNNRAGVNQGIALLGGNDNGGTKLWWDKK